MLRAASSVLCSLQPGSARRRAACRHARIESDERIFEQKSGANDSSARRSKKKKSRKRLRPPLDLLHLFFFFLIIIFPLSRSVFQPLQFNSQVDDRLGGEGTGKILGVSGAEGWAFVIVPTIIWSLYWASQKDIGDGPPRRGEGDDSGLSL